MLNWLESLSMLVSNIFSLYMYVKYAFLLSSIKDLLQKIYYLLIFSYTNTNIPRYVYQLRKRIESAQIKNLLIIRDCW